MINLNGVLNWCKLQKDKQLNLCECKVLKMADFVSYAIANDFDIDETNLNDWIKRQIEGDSGGNAIIHTIKQRINPTDQSQLELDIEFSLYNTNSNRCWNCNKLIDDCDCR